MPQIAAAKPTGYERLKQSYVKAGTVYTIGLTCWEIAKWGWAKYDQSRTFTLSIQANDALYNVAMDWFVGQIPPGKQRSLRARTQRPAESSVMEVGEEEAKRELALTYDSRQVQTVQVKGHEIKVSISKPDNVATDVKGKIILEPESLYFTAKSEAGQHAVVQFLNELLETTAKKRQPALWLLSSWGSWRRRNDLPLRDLDQVVLADGQLEGIVDDLSTFLRAEPQYNRRGLPYHRGYLLHGPPGTGKTSLVRALAKHFSMDLWYAPLGDLHDDANLLSLVGEVQPRSILLLEDVDVFSATQDRHEEKGKASLSGLLNALDGVATPHGLITIMTTNHIAKIDSALLRPGRMDKVIEIGHPNDEQATRLFQYFYQVSPQHEIPAKGRTTADLLEIFKRCDNPEAAELELVHA